LACTGQECEVYSRARARVRERERERVCVRERTPKAVPRHAHGLLLVVGKGLRIKKISPTAIFAKLAVSRLSAPPIPLCICSSALFCSCTSSLICTVIWRRAERHAGRLRQLLTRLCSSVHSSVDPICQMLRFNNTLIDAQHFGLAFHPRWMAETRLLSFAGNSQLWRLDVAKWSREGTGRYGSGLVYTDTGLWLGTRSHSSSPQSLLAGSPEPLRSASPRHLLLPPAHPNSPRPLPRHLLRASTGHSSSPWNPPHTKLPLNRSRSPLQ